MKKEKDIKKILKVSIVIFSVLTIINFIGIFSSSNALFEKSVDSKNSINIKSGGVYTISYNLNGGTSDNSFPSKYYITDNDITLKEPTREGYTFVGWTGTGLSALTKTAIIPKGSNENKIYTANWEANKYTAIFNGNGGSNGTSITTSYGSPLGTLPSATRTGYNFAGWFTDASGGFQISEVTTMPLNGATYYAHWNAIDYRYCGCSKYSEANEKASSCGGHVEYLGPCCDGTYNCPSVDAYYAAVCPYPVCYSTSKY